MNVLRPLSGFRISIQGNSVDDLGTRVASYSIALKQGVAQEQKKIKCIGADQKEIPKRYRTRNMGLEPTALASLSPGALEYCKRC